MQPIVKKIVWLTAFSIAMGFMETAIVIYLRRIYYPGGFRFPLIPIDTVIARIEVYREAATIIMLIGIGVLSGKNATQRFTFFMYCFAVWDIFYYIFLKLLIGWPVSFFTWDILFLIPIPWVGPVLAPCIIDITLILTTYIFTWMGHKGHIVRIHLKESLLLTAGCLTVILSFIRDYLQYVLTKNTGKHIWTPTGTQPLFSDILHYIPVYYNWWWFTLGELIIVYAVIRIVSRAFKSPLPRGSNVSRHL